MTNALVGLALVLAIIGSHTLAVVVALLAVAGHAAYFWYLGRE